ncbi:MAG: ABC transporter substrate-binding protein [Oscillibacter sp.]|nr:ABC transporter substrate-binding protein [Oscillibacter sp.]
MKKLIAVFLSLVMVLSLVACGGEKEKEEEKTPVESEKVEEPVDTGLDLGVDTIKIGYVGAMTGPSAGMGMCGEHGTIMAIEEINAAGGVGGVQLEYVSRDDEADPTKSFTYVEELIYKEGINMLIGAPNSACSAASQETISENGIINFLCTATSASIVNPELYPYTFRLTSTNDIQAESLVMMAAEGDYEKIVVIGDTTALGIDGFAATEKYAKQYGVEIAEYISYTADDADLSAVANSIKNAGADFVIAWALGTDAAKIIRVLDRIDYMEGKCEIVGYTGLNNAAFIELVADIETDNVRYLACTPWAIPAGGEKLGEKTQATYEKFNDRWGVWKKDGSGRVSYFDDSSRAYEAVYLYCEMIEKTGTLDPDAIKEALETYGSEYQVKAYEWEGGYSFSADDHEAYSAAMMCKSSLEDRLENEYVNADFPWMVE